MGEGRVVGYIPSSVGIVRCEIEGLLWFERIELVWSSCLIEDED